MEIPYTVSARRDTGLWNAKVGIWLFLASEVMLFGGLFSAYIFLRLDAAPGDWPHGLLNVPVGTMNTAILIASSVTVVLAWAALKMRDLTKYRIYMAITILCGVPPRKEITGHLHNKEALKNPSVKEYEIALDPVYADPTNRKMDRPHFWPMPATDKIATIEKSDVKYATMFLPKHSSYFASYFTITGLHGAHV
ncbi:MAG: hypothetical protein DME47_09435, partial [Verrucomicrobia bacterium]